jgi:hypothetical protein
MGHYSALIDRLFSSPSDRAIAESFADRFAGSPFADRIIPAMLQEGAQVNARIAAGELTPQAGRDLMMSMASDGYGLPPPHRPGWASLADRHGGAAVWW